MRVNKALVSSALALLLFATACSSSSDYVYAPPATLEEVGTDLWRVTLTDSAAERTGIETAAVSEATSAWVQRRSSRSIDGADRLVIPYSAVMYHFDGSTWTYTNPDGLNYLREPIDIDFIDQDRAVLISGPPVGSTVVSVGAAELYGVEFGIGK